MSTRPHDSVFIIPDPSRGFTLIELLVVMVIIAFAATMVTVAVNPVRQFSNARDTNRRTDLYSITSALVQYQIDNNGKLPDQDNFPDTGTCIGTNPPCINLGAYLAPLYLPEMPHDPSTGTPAHTQYFIHLSPTRQVVATAAGEIYTPIMVLR